MMSLMLRTKRIRVRGRVTTKAFLKIALKEIRLRTARNLLFLVPSLLILVAVTCAQNQAAGNPAVPPPSHPPVAMSPLVAPPPHAGEVHLKHILVISQTKGWEHDSIPDGMAAIYNIGHDSGLWDTVLRTDTELITKKDLGRNAKNLNYFDALV